MDFLRRLSFVVTGLAAVAAAHAQSTVPVLTQALPAQTIAAGGAAVSIDLRNYFSVAGVTGQVAQFDTTLGKFNIEFLANDAPKTVQNFLAYINAGRYQNSLVHRSLPGFVIQGGGFTATLPPVDVGAFAAVANEYKLSNVRGTLAMAKQDNLPNSATNQWFVNLADNSSNLNSQNGGFTVFARVIGTGMTVVDAIAEVPTYHVDNGAFSDLPLRDVKDGQSQVALQNLIVVNSVTVIPIYPANNTDTSVLIFTPANNNSAVVTATMSGSILTLTPIGPGTATISLRAGDINSNFASSTLAVTVVATAAAPVITSQPSSINVATGSSAVFNVNASGVPTPTYQWKFNGADIIGATGSSLILSGSAARTGNYYVTVTNASGSVTSSVATLAFTSTSDVGRLTNLSVLATLSTGVPEFKVATVIGGGGSTKPLLVRAVGPSLAQLGVTGVVSDPTLNLFFGPSLLVSNDNWGGSDSLTTAFNSVGAFAYAAADTKDAAIFVPAAVAGSYSVRVAGVGGATGQVIAELYDAMPSSAYSSAASRFLNVSVLKQVDASELLTVGFNIGGSTARTVLVRAAGPALADLGVGGTMSDPQLELYSRSTVLAANDNWGGDGQVNTVFDSVGAFRFTKPASKDAVVIATLLPGSYSAVVKGVNGSSGLVIVEVYDVP